MATANEMIGPFVYMYDVRYSIFKRKNGARRVMDEHTKWIHAATENYKQEKNIRSQQLRVSAQYRSD